MSPSPGELFPNLSCDSDGIWSDGEPAQVNYPIEGHAETFAVEDSSFWYAHRAACILALAERFKLKGPILDVGGGNGYMSAALEKNGIPALLVEPSRTGILNAKNRGLQRLIQADFATLSPPPGSLDAVGLFDVLEHVSDDKSFLIKIRMALRTNGSLYISVPTNRWLWSEEDVRAGHERRYTLKKLVRLLEESGFSIEYSGHVFLFLILPVFFMRTLKSLMGIRKPDDVAAYKKEVGKSTQSLPGLLRLFMRMELASIRLGFRIPFGTSGILCARAKELAL